MENKLIANALIDGGGVRVTSLIGALAVAEEKGYQWANLAGISTGAIVAALLAAGYTASELKTIMFALDYSRLFKDKNWVGNIPLIGGPINLFTTLGIYKGRLFENWIRELLKQKNVNTFGDLEIPDYRENGQYRFKLRIIASDVSRGRTLMLPQDITEYGIAPEELDVAVAVRMSMSIPFFYPPVTVRNVENNQTSYILDGGLFGNFPIGLFDIEGKSSEYPTIGFTSATSSKSENIPRIINGPFALFFAILSGFFEVNKIKQIEDNSFRIIKVPYTGVNTTDFGISRAKREMLYQSGRQTAEEFFTNRDLMREKQEQSQFVPFTKLIGDYEQRFGGKLV